MLVSETTQATGHDFHVILVMKECITVHSYYKLHEINFYIKESPAAMAISASDSVVFLRHCGSVNLLTCLLTYL